MKRLSSTLLCAAVAVATAATASAQCSSLTTTFNDNNGGNSGGQMFFDVNVTNGGGIVVGQIDTHATGIVGTLITVDLYTFPGSYVGQEANQAGWTLMSSNVVPTAGPNNPTVVDVTDFALTPGVHGFSVILTNAAHRYTGTNPNPPQTVFSNADITIQTGAAQNVPWSGSFFSPRTWNGTIRYNCPSNPPTVYCTAGTTTNGCLASINASGNPNVSHTAPCQITVTNVEGQKTGIVFYGLASVLSPWCSQGGGSSSLCVKAPTMRSGPQLSGGLSGQCNGQLALNWNAFQNANPSALGAPWLVGEKAYCQGWFRDPLACKTTSLSNAVELTYQP